MPEHDKHDPNEEPKEPSEAELDRRALEEEYGHVRPELQAPLEASLGLIVTDIRRLTERPEAKRVQIINFSIGRGYYGVLSYQEPDADGNEGWAIEYIEVGVGVDDPDTKIADIHYSAPVTNPADPDSTSAGQFIGVIQDPDDLGKALKSAGTKMRAQTGRAELPIAMRIGSAALGIAREDPEHYVGEKYKKYALNREDAQELLQHLRTMPADRVDGVNRIIEEIELHDGSIAQVWWVTGDMGTNAWEDMHVSRYSGGRTQYFEVHQGQPPVYVDAAGVDPEKMVDLSGAELEDMRKRHQESLEWEVQQGIHSATEGQAQWAIELLGEITAALDKKEEEGEGE